MNEYKDEKYEYQAKSVSIEVNENNSKEKNYDCDYPFGIMKIPLNDYLILIRKIPLLGIKYFIFGKTIHFYICTSLKNTEYKLSEIPTPLFTLGPECK